MINSTFIQRSEIKIYNYPNKKLRNLIPTNIMHKKVWSGTLNLMNRYQRQYRYISRPEFKELPETKERALPGYPKSAVILNWYVGLSRGRVQLCTGAITQSFPERSLAMDSVQCHQIYHRAECPDRDILVLALVCVFVSFFYFTIYWCWIGINVSVCRR